MALMSHCQKIGYNEMVIVLTKFKRIAKSFLLTQSLIVAT